MSTIGSCASRPGRLLRAVSAAVLPPVCCLCGARGQAPDFDLCQICAALLPATGGGTLEPIRHPGGVTPVRTLFLFRYAYPVDHFIRALKFRGERVFARVLGELLAREHQARGWHVPDFIVPMPLHVTRLRERGFNQAMEIARFAAASLGARVDAQLLVRRIATREQSGLSLRARRRNVRGAFEVVRPLPLGRIALLDDVVTTGSTAKAALDALRVAGAREVELWAIARAEKSGAVDVFQ